MKKMSKERDVKMNIKTLLESFGPRIWYFMPAANGYGRAGVPDFIGCCSGYFFSIEAKFDGNGMTAMQWNESHAIETAKGPFWLVSEKNIATFTVDFTAFVALCS